MMKPSIYHSSWILLHFPMHGHLNSSEFLLILWPRVLPSPFVLLSWIRKDSASTAFSIVTSNNFSLLKASTKFLTMKTRSAARTSLAWVTYILLPVSHHPFEVQPISLKFNKITLVTFWCNSKHFITMQSEFYHHYELVV